MRYVVKENEWLLKIAQDHGFRSEQPLLEANPELAQTYGDNPNVLPPGLEIEIPQRREKTEPASAGIENHYRAVVRSTSLCLGFHESDGAPMAGWTADLTIGTRTWTGLRLDDRGYFVVTSVPTDATAGQVRLVAPPDTDGNPAQPFTVPLEVGGVDPIVEGEVGRRAVQKLLTNLGFYEGPIDGDLEDDTRHALFRFQEEMGLVSRQDQAGLADTATCAGLVEAFGDEMPPPQAPEAGSG